VVPEVRRTFWFAVPGDFEVWSVVLIRVPRATKRWLIHALVMAAMVAGVTAFVSFDKTVQLTVDGRSHRVHTFASDVEGVLARQGISVGMHDTVVPELSHPVSEGGRIAVRFGRPIDLNLNGTSNRVWVTATSVHEALDQLGLRDENLFVSASRSAPIGRQGLSLQVLTPRDVTVIADGRTRKLHTAASTVRQLLVESGITLAPADEVNTKLDAPPAEGATIRVVRVEAKTLSVKVDVPFAVQQIKDPKMFPWEKQVIKPGVPGVELVTYRLVSKDGKPASKDTLATQVLTQPVTQIERVGTKPSKYAATGEEHLNWAALAKCESGGDPRSDNEGNGTYYGMYQFSPSTWRSVGGHGMPNKASAEEQTYRAQMLYKREHSHPWPVCGHHLYDR
jgi:uncharacterized protein YabE (DUF348 family)